MTRGKLPDDVRSFTWAVTVTPRLPGRGVAVFFFTPFRIGRCVEHLARTFILHGDLHFAIIRRNADKRLAIHRRQPDSPRGETVKAAFARTLVCHRREFRIMGDVFTEVCAGALCVDDGGGVGARYTSESQSALLGQTKKAAVASYCGRIVRCPLSRTPSWERRNRTKSLWGNVSLLRGCLRHLSMPISL